MATGFKEKVARLLPAWNKQHLIYGLTWAWFLLVSAAWLCIYCEAVAVAGELFSEFPITAKVDEALAGTWLGRTLKWAAGILLWWRVVKVVVLHGSPFTFRRQFTSGRLKRTSGGGMGVTLTYIGDFKFLKRNFYTKEDEAEKPNYESHNLLFGAILRPHPRSDKLVRSRLEYILLALPRGLMLLVTESKLKLGRATPAQRAELFDEHADRFEREESPKSKTKMVVK